MGKRSDFERLPRDFYKTPEAAVIPLVKYLAPCSFLEPCAGDGQLVDILIKYGFSCSGAFDIEPQSDGIIKANSLDIEVKDLVITNPPWDREILHQMIPHFNSVGCWLLFDADWMHTKQSSEYMKYCRTILSIGRVKWFPESKMVGKDNCCWYEFVPEKTSTTFIGR